MLDDDIEYTNDMSFRIANKRINQKKTSTWKTIVATTINFTVGDEHRKYQRMKSLSFIEQDKICQNITLWCYNNCMIFYSIPTEVYITMDGSSLYSFSPSHPIQSSV